MAIQNNFPAISPSLNLSFALTKALDPRITFARASAATYYGTDTAKAEENLLIRSQEFDNAAWIPGAVTRTANSTSAPDGTTTADTITAQAAHTGVKVISQVVTTSTATYTYSVFAKKDTHDFVQLKVANNAGAGFVNFDLNLGTLSATTATGTITDVGNGWYRCTMTAAVTVTNGFWELNLVTSLAAVRSESWTSVGTEAVFLWGAQLEVRAAATAYTPTTTQPITNFIPVLESEASGVARFDHNPNTFESLGLLIEEQRTNLLLRSEEFDNAGWAKTRASITANTIVAPDGTLTGDAFVEDTATGAHNLLQGTIAVTSGTAYTQSIYAKFAGRLLCLYFPSTQFGGSNVENAAFFNLQNGTIGFQGSGLTSANIVSVGNGWYRCSITKTATTTANTSMVPHATTSFSVLESYTGDGFSGIFIWGAQLEAGAFPTSYIPTVASQVTRAADAASMTGANFSSWYRADEGTLYAETTEVSPITNARAAAYIGDGTFSNRLQLYFSGDPVFARFGVAKDGFSTLNQAASLSPSNKLAGAHAAFDSAFVLNAGNVSSMTVRGGVVVDRLHLGSSATVGLSEVLNGRIKKLAFYPKRLTNAELQGLTS